VRVVEVLDTCRIRIILLELMFLLRIMMTQEVLTWIRHSVLVENFVLEEIIEILTAFGKRAEFRDILILNASEVDWCPS
jgi:hypothetical protein